MAQILTNSQINGLFNKKIFLLNFIKKFTVSGNKIEVFHHQIRKVSKTKDSFTSWQALEKLIFLTIKNISKNEASSFIIGVDNWTI
jgi:transposase-like protein